MNLKILTQDGLDTLRGNIRSNLKKYYHESNEWVEDFFRGQSPYREFKQEINDFTLIHQPKDVPGSDLENIKRVYDNLRFLSETQATDECFWAGLSHDKFWGYMQERWMQEKQTPSVDDVANKFFFSKGIRRSCIVHPIAKLWWYGHYTYDESRQNRYELTELLSHDISLGLGLFSNNYTNNPMITKAILGAAYEAEQDGIRVKREMYREMTKYVNLLGGIYILDMLDPSRLKEMVLNKLKELSVTTQES